MSTPRKPRSSAHTENTKSVVFTGRKFSWVWLPLVKPWPKKPPAPMAMRLWLIW